MKMTMKKVFYSSILMGGIVLMFLLLIVSCEKDSTDDDQIARMIGTWHQVSRSIDGTTVQKDSTRLVMQIDENNICILCDSTSTATKAKNILKRSGWSYNNGLLNIAIDLPASWKITSETNKLSLERLDFNQTGNITKTVIGFERMTNIELE
jgi:hypothetical protein